MSVACRVTTAMRWPVSVGRRRRARHKFAVRPRQSVDAPRRRSPLAASATQRGACHSPATGLGRSRGAIVRASTSRRRHVGRCPRRKPPMSPAERLACRGGQAAPETSAEEPAWGEGRRGRRGHGTGGATGRRRRGDGRRPLGAGPAAALTSSRSRRDRARLDAGMDRTMSLS